MSNKELLDWAVEHIEEWPPKFTHLRTDSSGTFYTIGDGWFSSKFSTWVGSDANGDFFVFDFGRRCLSLEAITKEEWQEAKQPKPLLSSILKDNLIVMQEYARRKLAGEGVDGLQYLKDDTNWCDFPCGGEPNFLNNAYLHRFKPEEVIHKGGKYPKPLTKEEGDKLSMVWAVSGAFSCGYVKYTKVNTESYYEHGLVFSAEEDAKQAAKVMFNIGD